LSSLLSFFLALAPVLHILSGAFIIFVVHNHATMNKTIHHGRNVKRFREMLGIKQEGLAYLLGNDWNQKRISALEQKEMIDNGLLEEVAKQLKVPAEGIKNFDEEAAVNVIASTFNDNAAVVNNNPVFNPLEN
jgi:hypothetical protein